MGAMWMQGFVRSPSLWLALAAAYMGEAFRAGRWLAPGLFGAWVQYLGPILETILLAGALLVALTRALRGPHRTLHTVMAVLISIVYVGETALYAHLGAAQSEAARAMLLDPLLVAERAGRAAWDGQPRAGTSRAKLIYQVTGLRTVYRDETGQVRVFEPSPELIARRETTRRNEQDIRKMAREFAERSSHCWWLVYARLGGLAPLLILIAIGARRHGTSAFTPGA
jgi:hypothetical protein